MENKSGFVTGLYLVQAWGYETAYVVATGFNDAVEKWQKWASEGEDVISSEMPDTVAFLTKLENLILM